MNSVCETHDIVRVDVLDEDALGPQLGRERFGPGTEEGLAARVDGEHGSRRGAGERAHVQDQALLSGYVTQKKEESALQNPCVCEYWTE